MSAPELAQRLAREGYAGLFLAGDSSSAGEVYHGNAAALQAIVVDDGAGALERVLAAEVLYGCGDGPDADRETLAALYALALALTGSHTLPGNLWGTLWASPGDDGPLGAHLLAQGEAAVPGLLALLDDDHPIAYEGSREAMLGNAQRYRVKDAAAFFLGRVLGRDVPFHEAHDDRDAEIGRLEAALAG